MTSVTPGVSGLDGNVSKKDPEEDWELLEKLGEGSYGSVWQGEHRERKGTMAAIKRVPIENDLQELMKEISHMKECSSPNIVSYFGSYHKDSELWIVIELCEAGSASDIMKVTDKPFDEAQIAAVIRGSLLGLDYLHVRIKKIHRDIKAGNLLLNKQGDVKLADFGVSGQLSDNLAKRHTVIGTPFWMAPEVIQEVGYDAKADIWSLGITVIELAQMCPPYANIHPMRAIFMIPSKPPPKLEEAEKFGAGINDFIKTALVKAPAQRPDAAALLKHDFIAKAPAGNAVLLPLIEEELAIIARLGRDAALGLEDEDDDDDDDDDDDEAAYSTIVRKSRVLDETETVDYGTMVVMDGGAGGGGGGGDVDYGTMKQVGGDGGGGGASDAGYVPQWMDALNRDKAIEKYAAMSTDQLKALIKELEEKKQKEIEAIKAKYAADRAAVVAALVSYAPTHARRRAHESSA
eukprot:CAMPEP_0198313778 /NCGR_PEP_ID=MMETSP1450-20131203/4662_1 /TAXON_ID=753684 ORGANISM="Madagascaria erythrocladiodes, Strain CCMP3234" /NCGR_SAMPLE_ID=MMETSP1450 /ASSEMBLY_ACC=CAM_ASM_001115 /LENGTH=461 /DNA_ID=CAMNT_0044016793 /DNA_START=20 /DNA_END=1406 /DNA_ORIENTATION=-